MIYNVTKTQFHISCNGLSTHGLKIRKEIKHTNSVTGKGASENYGLDIFVGALGSAAVLAIDADVSETQLVAGREDEFQTLLTAGFCD